MRSTSDVSHESLPCRSARLLRWQYIQIQLLESRVHRCTRISLDGCSWIAFQLTELVFDNDAVLGDSPMPEKKITVAAVNVVIHPHDAQRYIDLFKDALALKVAIPVHGRRHAKLVGTLVESGEGVDRRLEGIIATFTRIQRDGVWENEITGEPASNEEIDAVHIPAGLNPGDGRFAFSFAPDGHLLIVETEHDQESFTPTLVGRFFKRLFSNESIADKYGTVEVTVVPEQETVDRIVNSKHLRYIRMRLTRPNPDDLESMEEKARKRLEENNAEVLDEALRAQRGENLTLSEETKALARVAARNGYVVAKDAETREVISTKSHPAVDSLTFQDDELPKGDAFKRLVDSFLGKVRLVKK